MTFCARHLLCQVLGITLTLFDDDGNKGAGVAQDDARISGDQETELRGLLKQSGGDEDIFNEWLFQTLGADSLAELPAAHFERVKQALNKKIAAKGGNDG